MSREDKTKPKELNCKCPKGEGYFNHSTQTKSMPTPSEFYGRNAANVGYLKGTE